VYCLSLLCASQEFERIPSAISDRRAYYGKASSKLLFFVINRAVPKTGGFEPP